jgi:long-chain fatty acid transport protein
MSRPEAWKVVAAAALGLAPSLVSGNGLRLASQDAFATARGEAFAATADNPSAIYYNPAGITQLEGSHLRAGIYGLYLDPTFTPPPPANTNTFHIENKLAAAPQFFFSHTLEKLPLSFGLGIYAPFGAGIQWPQDTGFRAVAIEGKVTYVTINPVVAWEIVPGLSLGGGLKVNYANFELEQGLLRYEEPLPNYFRFNGEGWSLGYNLGALWQPCRQLSFGAAFRSASTVTLGGHTDFEQFPVIPDTSRSAQMDFTFPLGAVFGVSYRPTPKWNIEFNADYTDWSSTETNTIHQAPPPFPVKENIPVALNWKSSWMFEVGATRYFDSGWHVSTGYVFNQNSVKNETYSPLVADLNRHFFTVGAGHKGRWFDVDIAYQFGYGPDHTVSGSVASSSPGLNAGQNADGTYHFISHAIMLTVGIRF